MPRNTNTGTFVHVSIKFGSGIIGYGFRSRLRDSLRNDFGQIVVVDGIPINGLVVGANTPKPPRASKSSPTGYDSSYCASANAAALRADGYSITRSKPSKIKKGQFSDTYYATVNGLKIAFVSNALGSIGASEAGFPAAFGVTKATASDAGELIYSPDFPKLPTFKYLLASGKTFSSQADPSKADTLAASASYKEGKPGIYTAAHFAEYYQITAT